MPKIKAKLIDKNRFTKKYPLIRAPKKITFQGDTELEIEILQVEFVNQSEKEGFFEEPQKDTNYRVLVSARDTTASDSAQVTLSIDNALSDLSKVTILASAPFTGLVDVIVIRVG